MTSMTPTTTKKTLIRVIVAGLIFAGSFFGTGLYLKSIVTQLILNEFHYHFRTAQFYTTKDDPAKFLSHYLHAAIWAQRYEKITK